MSVRGKRRGPRRAAWIALALALLGGAFCIAGYALTASFLAAGAAPEPRLRSTMTFYLIGGTCLLLLAAGALVILIRDRASSASPPRSR